MIVFAYLGLLLLLFLLVVVFLFIFYLLGTGIFSAPFVPTSGSRIERLLKEARLKKGQLFVDLGSGDGRVVRKAVGDFGVRGVGVELNPLLVLFSQFLSTVFRLRNIRFINKSLFHYSLSDADVVYIFLVPKLMRHVGEKIDTECTSGTLIISHGFKLGERFRLLREIEGKPFITYFYRKL